MTCKACGKMDKPAVAVNAAALCPECGHDPKGHDEFGCKVENCNCVHEFQNTAPDMSMKGRVAWAAAPIARRAELINSLVRQEAGDMPHTYWSEKNFDELPENIRQALAR